MSFSYSTIGSGIYAHDDSRHKIQLAVRKEWSGAFDCYYSKGGFFLHCLQCSSGYLCEQWNVYVTYCYLSQISFCERVEGWSPEILCFNICRTSDLALRSDVTHWTGQQLCLQEIYNRHLDRTSNVDSNTYTECLLNCTVLYLVFIWEKFEPRHLVRCPSYSGSCWTVGKLVPFGMDIMPVIDTSAEAVHTSFSAWSRTIG